MDRNHDFPAKSFGLAKPGQFLEEPFCAVFQKHFGCEKVYGNKGRESNFPALGFSSHSAENFSERILYCVTIFGNRKLFSYEGNVASFCLNFCLAVPKNIVREPSVICFRKVPVPKTFGKEGGEYEDISSNKFCLTVSKNILGNFFVFHKTSGTDEGKFLWIRRGRGREYHDFLSKNFCHTVMESFVREPFIASLLWGIEAY